MSEAPQQGPVFDPSGPHSPHPQCGPAGPDRMFVGDNLHSQNICQTSRFTATMRRIEHLPTGEGLTVEFNAIGSPDGVQLGQGGAWEFRTEHPCRAKVEAQGQCGYMHCRVLVGKDGFWRPWVSSEPPPSHVSESGLLRRNSPVFLFVKRTETLGATPAGWWYGIAAHQSPRSVAGLLNSRKAYCSLPV